MPTEEQAKNYAKQYYTSFGPKKYAKMTKEQIQLKEM